MDFVIRLVGIDPTLTTVTVSSVSIENRIKNAFNNYIEKEKGKQNSTSILRQVISLAEIKRSMYYSQQTLDHR